MFAGGNDQPMAAHDDTIFALSSGGLPAGVAVIRISGPGTLDIVRALVGSLPPERRAQFRTIRDRNGLVLDRGLALVFPGPHSFTGEDCAELHLHGGKAVARAVLSCLAEFPRTRMAEAGEFSRRAFESGKIDLIEVEGLADLLVAETEMQRRLAVEHGIGGQSELYAGWSRRLTHARAMIEAELDFSDEADVPGSVSEQVWGDMIALSADIEDHLARQKAGEIIRDGFKVVIAGAPNAGKSSLLNALANREIAIVTEYAGTTRDVLHCDLDIGGYAVKFFDTAGLRDTEELIELEGIRRARLKLSEADLVLHLIDDTVSPAVAFGDNVSAPILTILTKADMLQDNAPGAFDLAISSKTGAGLDLLRALVLEMVQQQTGTSLSIPSRERHARYLNAALYSLKDAIAHQGRGLDIAAEMLRGAATDLGRITGRVDTEDLLDSIFSEFCIGK